MKLFSIVPNEVSNNRYDVIMFDKNNVPRVLFIAENINHANHLKNIFEDIYTEAIKDAAEAIKSCLLR